MEVITTIILSAAKAVGVSGVLLLAICNHESNGFTMNFAAHDHGSPSYGQCQVKFKTSQMLGFRGNAEELNDPYINAIWAAKYLKYQENRYGQQDWIKLVSSYNAGSYLPSNRVVNCPRNLKYVKLVQNKLPKEYRDRLTCEGVIENDN